VIPSSKKAAGPLNNSMAPRIRLRETEQNLPVHLAQRRKQLVHFLSGFTPNRNRMVRHQNRGRRQGYLKLLLQLGARKELAAAKMIQRRCPGAMHALL